MDRRTDRKKGRRTRQGRGDSGPSVERFRAAAVKEGEDEEREVGRCRDLRGLGHSGLQSGCGRRGRWPTHTGNQVGRLCDDNSVTQTGRTAGLSRCRHCVRGRSNG